MNWLFEPRSRYYDYEDPDSGGSESSWDWRLLLWLPVIVPLVFLIEIIPFLALAFYFLKFVYSNLKRTVSSGKLSYPFLAKAGLVAAIILTILFYGHSPSTPIHPSVSLGLAIGFIVIFTVLPISALCLHRILKIHALLNTKLEGLRSHRRFIIFLGIWIAAVSLCLVFSRSQVPLSPQPSGPSLGDSQWRPRDGMEMVFVPAGQFQTGRDGTDWHVAQVNGFWIDKKEVTDAQYRMCMAAGACDPPGTNHSGTGPYLTEGVYSQHPVIFVDTGQAETYCEWAGARLPTEAEWSYAARGPNSTTYPWGNTFDGKRLNYCDYNCPSREADKNVNDGYAGTAPVGTYPAGASWVGALDMSGNVWEMTSEGVVLGGSWYSSAANARTGSGYGSGGGGLDYGFRCAADGATIVLPDKYAGSIDPVPTSFPVAGPPLEKDSDRSITILVDDFKPQPYQGDSTYSYNRLEGDRGALNNSLLSWGDGQVTAMISEGNTWGGLWMSLNHPIREGQSINFSAILPPQILLLYQSRVTGIVVSIAGGTPSKPFRVELKDSSNNLQWANEVSLDGGQQTMSMDLPPLQDINQLVLVLDQAAAGDYVIVDRISLVASTPITDTPTAAFVWSYGMLLNNWDPSTGLVRDKAKDASGEFDAIQSTGSLAAATALAEQVGVIDHADAVAIVDKISDTLLKKLPRNHGLWPHWVKKAPDGKIEIVPDTEWSSVDTVIAAIGLLDGQQSLGLETSGTEQMIREIEWNNLVTEKGISHGYSYDDELIPYAWDVFGGESWLVELAYASAIGEVAPLAYPSAPTANGSGFIDELAWLYVIPPSGIDYWGTDWSMYRNESVKTQITYYITGNSTSCFTRFGLFGLSAAEVPSPAMVPKESIYQAFGVGGQFTPANDGSALLGSPVIAPHFSAMISSLQPETAIKIWDWLIANGYSSPLNNVESLTFPPDSNCTSDHVELNQLKGSWNLALQTLGWGRYIAERDGKIPAIWQATKSNPFLKKGYLLLAPDVSSNAPNIDEDISTIVNNSNISCEDESDYVTSLSGIFRYKFTDANGEIRYYSVEQTSESQEIEYSSLLGWPPEDAGGVPGLVSTTKTNMENIPTDLGIFPSLRVDTLQKYRVQTDDHDDPSGTIETREWYVCGLGLIFAIMDYEGMYQFRAFDRHYELELISFTPIP